MTDAKQDRPNIKSHHLDSYGKLGMKAEMLGYDKAWGHLHQIKYIPYIKLSFYDRVECSVLIASERS